jgi:hypothetical protein
MRTRGVEGKKDWRDERQAKKKRRRRDKLQLQR